MQLAGEFAPNHGPRHCQKQARSLLLGNLERLLCALQTPMYYRLLDTKFTRCPSLPFLSSSPLCSTSRYDNWADHCQTRKPIVCIDHHALCNASLSHSLTSKRSAKALSRYCARLIRIFSLSKRLCLLTNLVDAAVVVAQDVATEEGVAEEAGCLFARALRVVVQAASICAYTVQVAKAHADALSERANQCQGQTPRSRLTRMLS